VQRQFELHDLAIEDADHAHQRPKIEQYGDALFIVARTAQLDGDASPSARRICSSAKDISSRSARRLDVLQVGARTMRKLSARRWPAVRTTSSTPSSTFIVDNYSPVLETIQEEVEAMEAQVLASAMTQAQIQRLYLLRRDLVAAAQCGGATGGSLPPARA
jgi:magnesium transporter